MYVVDNNLVDGIIVIARSEEAWESIDPKEYCWVLDYSGPDRKGFFIFKLYSDSIEKNHIFTLDFVEALKIFNVYLEKEGW